mgnify:FL=1|tara:strand:- start:6790 stop:7620 length:831 start_codon:yes stop_codon:yes gene_type:complete
MYETVNYTIEGPVATITLNRPDRLNAITGQMIKELQDAIGQADANKNIVGIILTGAGRGFCAGGDIESLEKLSKGGSLTAWEMGDKKPSSTAEMGPDFQVGLLYLMAVRKPVIAAINGPCAGLGFVLAMACDIRFASDTARFTTAFANRGLIAEHGISWILPRLIGSAHALDLLLSGRVVDSKEAAKIGVVNRTFTPDRLLDESTNYVKGLAERSAPVSMKVIKQQVYRHLSSSLGEAARESIELMAESLKRPDFREGVLSYIEKRPPKFTRLSSE